MFYKIKNKKKEIEVYDRIREKRLYEDKIKSLIFYKRFSCMLDLSKNTGSALDVGCGEGYFIRPIKNKFKFYTGIDISPERIRIAKTKTRSVKSIKLIVADAENMPFNDDSFDTIFAADVLEHIANLNKVVKEISRIIKKNNSELIISLPTENFFYHLIEKLFNGKSYFHRKDLQDVRDSLEKYFILEKTIGIPFIIPFYQINLFIIQRWIPKKKTLKSQKRNHK